jgi:hypothetical protein
MVNSELVDERREVPRTRRRPRPRFDRARQDVIAGEKRISGNS